MKSDVPGFGPAAHRIEVGGQPVGVPVGAEPDVGVSVLADDLRVTDTLFPSRGQLLTDPQEDALAAYLAGGHPCRAVTGQRRPGHEVRVFRIRRVQPGEPG